MSEDWKERIWKTEKLEELIKKYEHFIKDNPEASENERNRWKLVIELAEQEKHALENNIVITVFQLKTLHQQAQDINTNIALCVAEGEIKKCIRLMAQKMNIV